MNFTRAEAGRPLTLAEMADVACLSRYHFARVFATHCAETPVAFLTRTRLEAAASSLVLRPELSITSIALEAGFSGSQAFSHAFRRRYAISPRRFRVQNLLGFGDFPMNQERHYPMLFNPAGAGRTAAEPWHVSLRSFPQTRLAYLRHIGPYFNMQSGPDGGTSIEQSFGHLIRWAKERRLWHDEIELIGLCPNSPSVTPPRLCQYDAGIAVDETVLEDDVVSIQTIPEMLVATVEMAGGAAELMAAWKWLIWEWIPRNGLEVAPQIPMEISRTHKGNALGPEGGMILCMPVTHARRND